MRDGARAAARGGGGARRPAAGRTGAARSRGDGRLARARALVTLLALAAACASCAKRGMPSGGPPDLEPPRLVTVFPDSGTAGVPADVRISLTFSEGMEPRSTGESVSLAPPIEFLRRRWSGRTLTIELAEPLAPRHTYTLIVGGQARDRHGNPFGAGTALWCYERGRAPDSTAKDFDAVGIADQDGAFRISGLAVPGTYRLWAFADLDGNRSYEPERDILYPVDTTFVLDSAMPVAAGLDLRLVNPRAESKVRGAVLDSLGVSEGSLWVFATSDSDTTVRIFTEVQKQGGFELQLRPGLWWLRAFRDLDKNRALKIGEEHASEALGIRVQPADDIKDVVLVLVRSRGVP